MSWERVNAELQKKYERSYVACHEPDEHEFIRVLITIHFPHWRKSRIEQAINRACKEIESPRDRRVFLKYLEEILEGDMAPHMKKIKQTEHL